MEWRVAHARTRVPKMARPSFWITTLAGSATFLQSWLTSEGDVGYLAPVSYLHMRL